MCHFFALPLRSFSLRPAYYPFLSWHSQVKLINQWASYTDHDGTPLRLRPHWAKENPKVITWGGKTYTGKEYIKMIYQEEFKEFKAHLNVVCEEGGYNLQELKQTFGNHYMDNIFESVWGDYNE